MQHLLTGRHSLLQKIVLKGIQLFAVHHQSQHPQLRSLAAPQVSLLQRIVQQIPQILASAGEKADLQLKTANQPFQPSGFEDAQLGAC